LVELLVVVAIIAILAALTLGTLGYVNQKGAESRARSEIAALSAAIDSYKLELGSYPSSNNLFTELTGQGPLNTNKLYFEPTPGIVDTNTRRFVDPWGGDYQYNPVSPEYNTGFFDLWSTAGGSDTNKFLRN
jgi:type II secretion system protein G